MAEKDAEMSFWDHLEVLRGTLFRSIAAVIVVSTVVFCFKNLLFKFVLWPSEDGFFLYKWLGWKVGISLVNLDITAQFFVHLKMAVMVGIVISFPFIIWEIWKFVAPALYEKEKSIVRSAFLMASALFYLGVACGYVFVLPVCLQFFMNYTVSDMVMNTISLNSYISLFVSLVLLIGLVFEFPSVIAILSRLGLVTKGMLKRFRKHAFVAILLISAMITPADPLSMFVLALPLYGLYEFSIIQCKEL